MIATPAADVVLWSILGLIVVENLLEIYLSLRQIKVYKTALKVPSELKSYMSDETFQKARIYGLDQQNFGVFKAILVDVFITCLELYLGFYPFMWNISLDVAKQLNWSTQNEVLISCIFVVLITLIKFVMDVPFKVYKTFVLEEKHGFNKQTGKFFIFDQLKGIAVGIVLSTPITAIMIYIVQRGGQHFFIWMWLVAGLISLLVLTIYPILIAPLFDKYRPLEEGPLRESIENLAASLKFPLTKLYVVEGSKRSSHSNAYFYGLWNSKRIVLFDTLLLNKGQTDDSELKDDEKGKGCTNEEVLAVLGHELGHWKLGHITKNIIIAQIHLLLMFTVFGFCFNYPPFYEAVGFESGTRPILIGILVVFSFVMAPYNALVNFGMTILSRKFEYQADEFAQQLGYSNDLGGALIKLNLDNLGFPVYDRLYSSWNHSHPTLLQRLDRLKQLNAKKK